MQLFGALLPTVHRQAPIIRRDIAPLHAVSCHTEADNVWQLAATSPLVPLMFVSECDEEFLQGANRFHRYLYKSCLVKQCNASHTITQISTFDFSPPPLCRESEPALHISIVPGVSESARCSHQRWTRGHAADQSDDSRAEGELELLLRADRRARVRLPACPLQTFTVT